LAVSQRRTKTIDMAVCSRSSQIFFHALTSLQIRSVCPDMILKWYWNWSTTIFDWEWDAVYFI